MLIYSASGDVLKTWGEHSVSNPLQQLYQSYDSGRKRLASLPVCPKCERAGFRDKGWALEKRMCCPHCGYNGIATEVYSAYVDKQLYK